MFLTQRQLRVRLVGAFPHVMFPAVRVVTEVEESEVVQVVEQRESQSRSSWCESQSSERLKAAEWVTFWVSVYLGLQRLRLKHRWTHTERARTKTKPEIILCSAMNILFSPKSRLGWEQQVCTKQVQSNCLFTARYLQHHQGLCLSNFFFKTSSTIFMLVIWNCLCWSLKVLVVKK